ncbi:MAG: hypothetical protein IIC96_17275 [Chloroflexi bacterium]|nr:hypothetical protein [Chloroflexota bacterium]
MALQETVRAEVSSQIAIGAIDDRNGSRDLEALRVEIELGLAEPLINLQGDLAELRLELERVRSLFDALEFEFARRDQLDELRMEIDNVRFSRDPRAEFDLRSDLDQFEFEFQSIRNEFETLGRQFDLELEQLLLETDGVRRLIENVEEALRVETDSLHRRIDAVR